MAKLRIPAVTSDDSNALSPGSGRVTPGEIDTQILYYNVIPVQTKDKEWSIMQRPTFSSEDTDAGASTDYGRGMVLWDAKYFLPAACNN